ncbi:PREDICTED: kinesin-like protein KIF25 [Galeopterus variegatus]|uniref:Kinesin-like protein KIF25 n=1 Tax=Galeopterus variegatus TaxID=482537 RepID=A0ABM0SHN6_GALVR|nr:PREDICTED: kinesin-like protein KIF25 [Galeopterus variegatus]
MGTSQEKLEKSDMSIWDAQELYFEFRAPGSETELPPSSELTHRRGSAPAAGRVLWSLCRCRAVQVYGPAESQSVVFGDVCPLLTSLLDGYNVCIMAYGQTGSGKSYTMLGPHPADGSALPLDARDDVGIIPRAAAELFRLISEDPSRSTKVEVSIVEVYNNDIFDLLAKDNSTVASVVKRELKTTKEGRTEVSLRTCEAVCSAAEFMKLVHGGLQLRVKHPTLVHDDSSRSHLIITVTLTTAPSSDSTERACRQTLPREPAGPWPLPTGAGRQRSTSPRASPPRPADPAGRTEQVRVQLQLVDLAGSECTGLSGVTGLALRETSFINRSLAALADVLGALSERRSHVPYRNSKLTRLLQDSLVLFTLGKALLPHPVLVLCEVRVSEGRHRGFALRGGYTEGGLLAL